MGRTAEIIAEIQAVGAAVAAARTNGGQAHERAGELAEEAAAHGWDGVAAAMQSARDALEEAVASLGTAGESVEEMVSPLGEISDQSGRPDVASRLGQALDRVERIRTALGAASSGVDDARTAAEQAGSPDSLMSMLQTVGAETDTAWRGLDGLKAGIEAERQESTTWGN